eukprot:Em0008g440a
MVGADFCSLKRNCKGDTVLMLQMLSDSDSMVTASAIRKWTNTDPLLSMVRRMVLQACESQLDPEFKPYMQRRYDSVFKMDVSFGVAVLWYLHRAIRVLRHTFATHGLPDILVSDNGTAFTSAEFQFFVKADGFRHYRLTPHSTAGQSPAELLLGRKPKSHLDLVFPSLKNQVQQQQERQKDDHDQKASHRTFMGPVTVLVKLEDGKESRYQIDHIRSRNDDATDGRKETIMSQEQDVEDVGPLDPNMPPVPEKQLPTPTMADAQFLPPQPQPRVDPDYRPVLDPVSAAILRRSTRPNLPPERYGL